MSFDSLSSQAGLLCLENTAYPSNPLDNLSLEATPVSQTGQAPLLSAPVELWWDIYGNTGYNVA